MAADSLKKMRLRRFFRDSTRHPAAKSAVFAAYSAAPGTRLLWQADPILVLVTQLRATSIVADVARLRTRIVSMLQEFQQRASAAGIEPTRVSQAMEVLCALVDHVVASLPWGSDPAWRALGKSGPSARRPTERVLDVARVAASDRGMSELICIAVGLGFDVRSRGQDADAIEQMMAELTKAHARGARALSPQSPSSTAKRSAWTSWLPLWVSGCVIAALLAVLFFAMVMSLGAKSDQLYARVAALSTAPASPQRPQAAATPRLAAPLAQQIAERELFVRDEIDRSVIVISESKLFDAGSATLGFQSADVLRPIAAVLQRTPGRIQVIGHTEAAVARSARYPSDWEFSVDRARVVQNALRQLGIESSRLTHDGRANVEPLAADDAARAVSGNGRVEILLLAGR
jgi:type VI secretion system protein ImpK